MKKLVKFIGVYFIALLISACESKKSITVIPPKYLGPIMVLHKVETLYSDSAKLKMKVIGPLQWEFETGDRKFPKGLTIYFYNNETQKEESELKSNYGEYTQVTNIYKFTGNVRVENKVKKETLKTEELNWNPTTKQIYTDKPVVIQTASEILHGVGLEASTNNMSDYKIKKVTGIFSRSLQ